jgi:hypothetical protein
VSTNVTLNGVSYSIPDVGQGGWGEAVSSYLIALSTGVLAKTGGTFTLTADVDFGATYGLKATKFASRNTPATTGVVRLGNNESVAWRNAANGADLALKVNASDALEFNGNPLLTLALGSADTVLRVNSGGTAYEWSKLVNANLDDAAAVARSKLAAGTASHVVINDGSGNFSSEATLAKSRGGTGQDNSSLTFPTSGTLVELDATQTLTNKTLTSPTVSNPNVTGTLTLLADPSNYIGLKSPASVTPFDYTFPVAPAADSGYVLTSTQAGVMSWVTAFVNPMDAAGQLIYGGTSGAATKLAAGTSGQVLKSNGAAAPSWVSALAFGNGGSASTAQYGFDADTGWYSDSAGVINATIDGTKRFSFDFASSTTNLTLYAANTGQAFIYFGDAASPQQAHIGFSDNSGSLFVANGGLNRIVVTSGGAVTLGTDQSATVGHTIQNNTTGAVTLLVKNHDTTSGSSAIPALRVMKGSNDQSTSQVFQQFYSNNGSTANGSITGNGANQATFTATSDARLKTNIETLPSQLANVCALRPTEFDYLSGGHQIGFIAQEIQEVYPDLVAEGPDGYLTVAGADKMTARLVSAIQGLNAKVEALQAQVDLLAGA